MYRSLLSNDTSKYKVNGARYEQENEHVTWNEEARNYAKTTKMESVELSSDFTGILLPLRVGYPVLCEYCVNQPAWYGSLRITYIYKAIRCIRLLLVDTLPAEEIELLQIHVGGLRCFRRVDSGKIDAETNRVES
ncbi:hypothetical protein BDY19DRAFT_910394 [Irpex rosettiformis]|uniref:Uncharacterized protein n=1 Tax=Irpex rosettiformis TaxID=378272 RepID=A0ACB8TNW7_9APHY|nr:hypothetical protein BDY19DRAFT_910394 [Irpex rosettiformis]